MPIFMMRRRMRSGCVPDIRKQRFRQLIYKEEGGADE